MSIGILRIKFFIPGVRSLKEKRSILQPFIHKIRNNYNISINTLGGESDPSSATLGLVHIAKHRNLNHKKLSLLLEEAEKEKNLQIQNHSTEVI